MQEEKQNQDGIPSPKERAKWIAILESLGYKVTPPNSRTEGSIEERKEVFKNKLKKYLPKYGGDMLNMFFLYWTQINDGGTKMLFEKQKAFQIPNRLATWHRNNYGNNKSSSLPIGMNIQDTKNKDYEKGLERWNR